MDLDDYIRKSDVIDCISSAKAAVESDFLAVRARKELDKQMPDEIGIVWKAIADKVCGHVEDAISDNMVAVAERIVEDSLATIAKDHIPPTMSDIFGCTDADGCDTAELVNSANSLQQVMFLRAFVGRLSPEALTALHGEMVRS